MKVFVMLAEGFEEIEAITSIDVLVRGEVDVTSVSASDSYEVKGSKGIIVKAQTLLKDIKIDSEDMIVLPGGMPGTRNLEANEILKKILINHFSSNGWLAAICAAPLIYGKLNFLKGKKAICYPGFESDLVGATITDERVVVDGRMITSKAAATSMEFALKLVEIVNGKDVRDTVAKGLIYG